jgi:hypothetical protein
MCLLLIFAGAFIGFALLTGSFWNLAKGNLLSANKLQKVGVILRLRTNSDEVIGRWRMLLRVFDGWSIPSPGTNAGIC